MCINYTDLVCRDTTSTSGSGVLQFSPIYTSNGFTNFLYASDACVVNTYLKYTSSLAIEEVSLHSKCLSLSIESLEISGFETILGIYSQVVTVFPPDGMSNIRIQTSTNIPTSLGDFITLYPLSGPNIEFLVFYNQPGIFGIMHSTNLSLFDTQLVTDIFLSSQQLTFNVRDLVIFNSYEVDIVGSATTDLPWEAMQIYLQLDMKDFHETVQEYVLLLFQNEADYSKKRLETCQNSNAEVSGKVSSLEQTLSDLQTEYTDISDMLDKKLEKQQSQKNTKEIHESILLELLEEYENITIEFSHDICEIMTCDKTCKGTSLPTTCFEPSESESIEKTCTKYVVEPAAADSNKKTWVTKYYCKYVQSCGGGETAAKVGAGLFVAGAAIATVNPVVGGAIAVVGIVTGLFGSRSCDYRCIPTSELEIEWVPIKVDITKRIDYSCSYTIYTGYREYTCNYDTDCSYLEEDEVCSALNQDCAEKRITALDETREDVMIRVIGKYNEYTLAAEELSMTNFEVSLLQVDKASIAQEINATQSSLESTQVAHENIIQSCNIISDEVKDGTCIQQLIESNGIDNLVQIQRLSSDVTVQTETPVILSLDVSYEIPYKQTTHQTTINIDFTAPTEIAKHTLGNTLFDELVFEYTGSHPVRKRQTEESILDQFLNNCNKLKDVLSYFQQVMEILDNTHENTIDIISNITTAKQYVIEDSDAILNTLSRIQSNYSKILIENEEIHREYQVDAFQKVIDRLYSSETAKWQNNMEEVHSIITSVAGKPCQSFSDCLIIALEVLHSLLLETPNYSVQDIRNSTYSTEDLLASIAINGSLEYFEIKEILNNITHLVEDIDEMGYWCATTPIITIHPTQSVNLTVGSTLELDCQAVSTLDLTYRWKNSDRTVGKSKSLHVENIKLSDAGAYHCEVYNAVGKTKSNQSLVVVYQSPYFAREPSSINTFVGAQSANFTCDIRGYPIPEFSWFYHQNKTAPRRLVHGETQSTYQLHFPQVANEGWYICQGKNSFGVIESTPVYLLVLPATLVQVGYEIEAVLTLDSESRMKNSSLTAINESDCKKHLFETLMGYIKIPDTIKLEILNSSTFADSVVLYMVIITTTEANSEVENTIIHTQAEMKDPSNGLNMGNIINITIASLQDLEIARINLESQLQNASQTFVIVFQDEEYTLIPNKVKAHAQRFLCPEGYEFNGNELVCGELI